MVNVWSTQKVLFLTRWQLASIYSLLVKADVEAKRNCDKIAIVRTKKLLELFLNIMNKVFICQK